MSECAYRDEVRAKVDPRFKCPPCSGEPTHRVRNYWAGEARRAFGPDMKLCGAHADWWGASHAERPQRIPAARRRT